MSDPSCRAFRELLGVYVVGAIEPAERTDVDTHLAQCYECREELATLAALPSLLHRVSREEAERLAAFSPADDQPADLLNSLLRQVGSRRRARRLKAALATAAAIVIAAGGAAAATKALAPASHSASGHRPAEVASVSKAGIGVTVRYGSAAWGTFMSVRATGLPAWTRCTFSVVTKAGRRVPVGGWTVGPGGYDLWYPVRAGIPKSDVAGFILTASDKAWTKVLRIPPA